ncbi:hypothetical protein ES703_108301 [subsurface metagenome]
MSVLAPLLGLGMVKAALMAYAAMDLIHMTITKRAAFEEAQRLSNGKGVINIGAGPHRFPQSQVIAEHPEVMSNLDIVADGMPHFRQIDVESEALPFADKQFGCAFASHILEHLESWPSVEFALSEMVRVADYVVVVLPHPAYFSGWLAPEHRQHFSRDDIDEMVGLYPNVTIFY